MNLPTERQALVFWLHATGMTCRRISEQLGCSPEAARNVLVQAQQKARKTGLSYSITQPKQEPNESGMGIAMRLAKEAKLI
jgi:transposase